MLLGNALSAVVTKPMSSLSKFRWKVAVWVWVASLAFGLVFVVGALSRALSDSNDDARGEPYLIIGVGFVLVSLTAAVAMFLVGRSSSGRRLFGLLAGGASVFMSLALIFGRL
jgi:hypothetical protein